MSDTTDSNKEKYFSLSPSSDIKAPVYFAALEEKLNNDSIKNIAITGTYGSGKSSILESHISKDTKNKYLKISLANFCEANDNLTPEDEKKIEEHILQQLFYQLSHSNIPFSGFKKITHLNKKSQQKVVISIIIWLFSFLLMPKVIKLLNSNLETISSSGFKEFWKQIIWSGTTLNIITLGIFCTGLFYILKEIARVIQKGQLKKVAMKSAQVELSDDSALNKHIDELIYFFEATDNNIVIIEDLDRFNSIELFSKLREVNFLINNSPKVNQVVKFIYAVRDEIFTNNLSRTKFFDFILPIVPVINTTNSGDILRGYLKEDSVIPKTYINDISLYIHDLRLMKNIVNEYWVYNGIINEDNKKKGINLFSIILYKNLFPNDFGLEHSEKGLLYKIFKERKNTILKELITSSKNQKDKVEEKKNILSNETAENEVRLREEYILGILKTHLNVVSICGSSISDISTSSDRFNQLLTSPNVQQFQQGYGRPRPLNIDFKAIQKNVNSNYSYEERLELLKQRKIGKERELSLEITKCKKEIALLERKKMSALIRQYKDNSWKDIILDSQVDKLSAEEELLALLIRKGYIDENYQLYMSYFYEGALSLGDFEYLINVKNGEGENFNTKLSNINELVSRITVDEYEYETTINQELISYFLKRPGYRDDNRLELLLMQFKHVEGAFEKYILPLIESLKGSPEELQRFIELLVDRYYPTIWAAIEQQNYENDTKDDFLRLFLFLSEDKIQSLNASSGDENLKKYLSTKTDFIQAFNSPSEIGDIIKLIKALSLKFQKIEFKRYDTNQIFNHIYQNDNYELNEKMLYLMLYHKHNISPDEYKKLFYEQNYTCTFSSSYDVLNEYLTSNFDTYVKDIYLNLESEQNESEIAVQSFIELLDNENDSNILFSVLSKVSTQIVDIEEFGMNEKWSLLFDTNCVEPNWNNLMYYFKFKEKTVNKTIINWLNRLEVCNIITKNNLEKEHFSDDDSGDISSLMSQIIENNSLEQETYENLLFSFPYIFHKINLEELSSDKISKLIEFRKLIFNTHYYDLLISLGLLDELITFTRRNISKFIKEYNDYDFNLELHKGLLTSGNLKFTDQKSLIELISIDNISDSEIASLIGNILLTTKKSFIENGKLIHVIRKECDMDLKLKLFDKLFNRFDFEEIDVILENAGGVYKQASELRRRPTWKKDKLNLSIAQKLKEIQYFHSIDIENKKEIKIVVRYN